jgi:hypothetical protein
MTRCLDLHGSQPAPRRFFNGRAPLILFWIKYTGRITLFLRNVFVQKRSAKMPKELRDKSGTLACNCFQLV